MLISELRRTAKWREPPEGLKREDELVTGEELKLFQSEAVQFSILAMDRVDLLYSVEESMRKMASPRAPDLAALQRIARFTINNLRMAGEISTDWIGQEYIGVFGGANFAGSTFDKKATGGGVALWSGRFAKAWSKPTRILPLRSGESELATVVRAPTEGMGLQSTLSDFSWRGDVGNQGGCNCCDWDGPSFGLRKVSGENSSLSRFVGILLMMT